MTASMNTPQNPVGSSYVPPDPRWDDCGIYVEPTPINLGSYSGGGGDGPKAPPVPDGAARTSFAGADTNPPLNERDYAPDRWASGGDVDRHIATPGYHDRFYGELGPRPYPV